MQTAVRVLPADQRYFLGNDNAGQTKPQPKQLVIASGMPGSRDENSVYTVPVTKYNLETSGAAPSNSFYRPDQSNSQTNGVVRKLDVIS